MQDGNIHCHIGNVSSKNEDPTQRSAVAAASYQSGETLFSVKKNKDVTAREVGDDEVVFKDIAAPNGAPEWTHDRAQLWNKVEGHSKRKDQRLAKKIEVAFTRDIPAAERLKLLNDFIKPFVNLGCVVDMAIHNDPEDHNPHAHIMLTTFALKGDGFGAKIKDIDQRKFINQARKAWADLTNHYLDKVGSPLQVDHRSYKARGIDAVPTQHRGPHQEKQTVDYEHNVQPIEAEQPLAESLEMERPEQESDMQSPSQDEKEKYPLLANRDTWPPSERPTPDMKLAEREELHRYWQDVQLERMEEDRVSEPKAQSLEIEETHLLEPERSGDQAYHSMDDSASRSELYNIDIEMDRAMRDRITRAENDVWKRAVDMKQTPSEKALLNDMRDASPEMKQAVKDMIISKRLEKVRAEDNAQRQRLLEKAMDPTLAMRMKEFAREHIAPVDYHNVPLSQVAEQELPVPGPDNEPRHPDEMEEAINKMLEDFEDHAEQEEAREKEW